MSFVKKIWGILTLFVLVLVLYPSRPLTAESLDGRFPVIVFIPGFFTPKHGDRNPIYSYLADSYARIFPEQNRFLKTNQIGFITGRPVLDTGSIHHPALMHPDLAKPGVSDTDLSYESKALVYLIHSFGEKDVLVRKKLGLRTDRSNCLYRRGIQESWKGLAEEVKAKTGKEIALVFVATSAGALKVREYFRLCEEMKVPHRAVKVIFLAGANRGSSIPPEMDDYFNRLLMICLGNIRKMAETSEKVTLLKEDGTSLSLSYGEIYEKTLLSSIEGEKFPHATLRKIFVSVLINMIPFDNGMRIAQMTTVKQLNPRNHFAQRLRKSPLPRKVSIINLTSESPESRLFRNAAVAMGTDGRPVPSDGVLRVEDTLLLEDHGIQFFTSRPSDHAKMAKLELVSDLRKIIHEKYPFLKLMIKTKYRKKDQAENELLIQGAFKAILNGVGYDLDNPETMENYSIFDYFMENDLMPEYWKK